MDELTGLLRPSWGAEKWILEGWDTLAVDEKKLIKSRMDDLFKDGLPFELKSDKLFYIYTFSLLAQLEVLAIQVPLKFEAKMSTDEYRERLHIQLIDEIFHGLVFTKIVYMLCAPYATPPEYSPHIERLCDFIRNEDCPKTALMLLNLVGEGWIEEIFYSLERKDIAPKVFEVILEDEHRHVCEADLYRDIGLPDIELLKPKIAYLEEQLITNIFMQYKYIASVSALLGVDGMKQFKTSLDQKHQDQLSKIDLKPTDDWNAFMELGEGFLPQLEQYVASNHEVEMSPIRKVFMTQWSNPSDPTMAGQFNVNVSCIDFFNKKFPSETITTLMMQAISLGLSLNPSFRNYVNFRKIFRAEDAYVGLVVKLPDCGDHIATIVFKNCHELSLFELTHKIKSIMKKMAHCYKKREAMENDPKIQELMQSMIYDFAYNTYDYPIAGTPFVSLSSIGFCGYNQGMSPLRRNESMKFTLFEIERKPVWNKETQTFEPVDILPVSISADHRIFDGNLPVPQLTNTYFNTMFNKMLNDMCKPQPLPNQSEPIEPLIDLLLSKNTEITYKALFFLQTYWFDFVTADELLSEYNDLVTDYSTEQMI